MGGKNKESEKFWYFEKDKIKIKQTKLLRFLEYRGYGLVGLNNVNFELVKKSRNVLRRASLKEMYLITRRYLEAKKEEEVLEVLTRGNYLSASKREFMQKVEAPNDKDRLETSRFYFSNCLYEVSDSRIDKIEYDELKESVWENRIINRELDIHSIDSSEGQFETFVKNITGNCPERFKQMKCTLGYLLHRNKERRENKAVIFYDEAMSFTNSGEANGGTGKSLLVEAIKQCREVVTDDGKSMKIGSWFKNQKISITTDIYSIDDLDKNISIENFYTMITGDVQIEKKRMDAYEISYLKAPKLVITSNYPVAGPKGVSTERRKHEVELANYYNAEYTPEHEFGNMFFSEQWDKQEWNKFYMFMLTSVQLYLNQGLKKLPKQNLKKNKLLNDTNEDFVEYMDTYLIYNEFINKKEFYSNFIELYTRFKGVSSKQFTIWIKHYCDYKNGDYKDKNPGGKYQFKISLKEE